MRLIDLHCDTVFELFRRGNMNFLVVEAPVGSHLYASIAHVAHILHIGSETRRGRYRHGDEGVASAAVIEV